ncbi:MAG: Na/Pi cotransporter family protein [Burkholderiales bacterium]|nr:Na/Pi cotransporter family protein [Burkholderiales bacterium]
MSSFTLAGGIAGGVGLFLLGMWLMTDGLKLAAGPALERILANSTKTRLRGLASGIMVTALVQSSSAVTVATIGFVNAGLLNLSQALWVLFGTNVGTTMTGWLVALVGLQFKIEALALPLIGIGMILRLTGEHTRRSAFGMALAGFGVMFLGIDLLRETFSGLSTDFRMPEGNSALDTLVQVLIGMALTVLMQSSSAALAVALTAAQGGLLTAQGAAAVVIGANIGTTVKAIIAAIGATPPAKRAACAHILFNLLTGAVALLMLPWLIALIALIGDWLDIESSPAAQLALFHTVFNVLGIILIWPIAARMTRFLESRFRTAEEDEALPRYIDRTVLAVPTLALDALEREVRRMGSVALRAIRGPLDFSRRNAAVPAAELQVVIKLNRAISEFIVEINRAGMSGDSAERLPELLRATRYYEVVGELAAEAATASSEASSNAAMSLSETVIAAFQETSTALLATVDPLDEKVAAADREAALRTFELAYQDLKAELLRMGATGALRVGDMDALLRSASALRRGLEQAAKAAQMLGTESGAEDLKDV